ncbi:MAG TPA: DNA methyltransferase [Thermoguttaceae bacterium]
MPISWNEIRQNAIGFAREWAGARSESAEKQTFWNEFFEVFGLRRRTVAAFEEPVKNLSGDYDHIDLFWRGMLLVEHKSLGKDLGKAESQAFRYIQNLISAGRKDEVPRYIIVSDFARIALHDLEPDENVDESPSGPAMIEFPLAELHHHIHDFAFIPGYQQHRFKDQDPINLQAVGIMSDLHDALEDGGYKGHELERLLVRVLFCLFAEDTGIFERDAFKLYIEDRTKEDGSDLGLHLARLFDVLNTPEEKRQKNLDETLAAFPYVNGELFAEKLGFADFNRDMRNSLLACTRFYWSRISPAIFGSLFQGVMEPRERRQIGGHYTSERDILKVIHALFLDDLWAEFDRIKGNKNQLKQFHQKIARLRFLDPACGCGNFLVIAYRELRFLEIELLKALHGTEQQRLEIQHLSLVDVDAFYGIEISEWPARIAEVAMWLMDHQMNIRLSEAFGLYFVRLPLKKSPTIVCGNALRLDWKEILPPEQCSYVLGNPPFVGGKYQTDEQRSDMYHVAGNVKNSGLLDYVTGWYFKASEYIKGTKIVVGFVSTNSITQGEQVGTLWNTLFERYGIKIHFGHRTFSWESEARGKAHVHVVIIGFAAFDNTNKRVYECQDKQATVTIVKNISPYLVEGPDIAIVNRQKPLCDVPEIGVGNKPIDDGNYLFTPEQKAEFLKVEPKARKYFRLCLGSDEFINGLERWCLWLGDCPPEKLRQMPEAMKRVEAVRKFRINSKSAPTKKLAEKPTRFHVENMPKGFFLLIPRVSSEKRRYIPMGFISPRTIVSDAVLLFPNAKLYHFGVLSSVMNMAWVRQVCGRLESRYRYSAKLVYNNYPWPKTPTEKQRAAVEAAAQAVLDAREEYLSKGSTLADLYDPLAMPPKLVKAHAALDRAVDRCYRSQPFTNERQRVEFLFALYEKLTLPLIASAKKKKR